MSQVYATEPSTSGRVVIETSHGPLEIQLWCRECPLTTKLFLQLCMDGFYDGMLFHRIVPDFLVQTGAIRQPPASQDIMDATCREAVHAQEALDRRQYEIHSRLRFNHRGQVAMALGIKDDEPELQPQFFVTLDEAPYLDGTHVLFGTITGPTMFNALRIGRTDVDESTNQPSDMEHAPRVLSVKIVENPIHTDLVPQTHVPWKVSKEEPALEKKKKRRKGKKDLNVLSFGDEMEDFDVDTGIKSCHDVVASEVLSNEVDDNVKEVVSTAGKKVIEQSKSPEQTKKPTKQQPAIAVVSDYVKAEESAPEGDGNPIQEAPPKSSSKPDFKEPQQKAHSAVEARLAKYKKLKSSTNKKQREEDTMVKLLAFQGKVRKQVTGRNESNELTTDNDLAARMARKLLAEQQEPREQSNEVQTYRGQVLDNSGDEEQEDSWLTTKFKCRKHMDVDSAEGGTQIAADGRTMDDYRVVDERHGHRDRKRRKHHSKRREHDR